jgi:hypothetical protein
MAQSGRFVYDKWATPSCGPHPAMDRIGSVNKWFRVRKKWSKIYYFVQLLAKLGFYRQKYRGEYLIILRRNVGVCWLCSYPSPLSTLGEYFLSITLTPLEIVYNKPHPSVLLHLQDKNTQKVLIWFRQELKRDIIFRHVQLKAPRRSDELQRRIQADRRDIERHILERSTLERHILERTYPRTDIS